MTINFSNGTMIIEKGVYKVYIFETGDKFNYDFCIKVAVGTNGYRTYNTTLSIEFIKAHTDLEMINYLIEKNKQKI